MGEAQVMPSERGMTVSDVVGTARGIYERVARRLEIDASMVSRVASGKRMSPEIDAALREELRELKKKLDIYDRENP
jgi:transcriptional regulator with XRE-family HTH domain